jgi:hypothetical protein
MLADLPFSLREGILVPFPLAYVATCEALDLQNWKAASQAMFLASAGYGRLAFFCHAYPLGAVLGKVEALLTRGHRLASLAHHPVAAGVVVGYARLEHAACATMLFALVRQRDTGGINFLPLWSLQPAQPAKSRAVLA